MDMVAQLEQAFVGAQQMATAAGVSADLYEAGQTAYVRANALNQRACSFSDALSAASLYGESKEIARRIGEQQFVTDIESRFLQLLASVSLPNRDEARVYASRRFIDLGNALLSAGDKKIGAMALTNGAMVLCEMNNATYDQMRYAYKILDSTLGMRAKGSVDFAYGRLNLALAERQVARLSNEPDVAYIYKNILRGLDQAKKVFKKHNERVSKSIHHMNVIDTLDDWLDYEIDKARPELYSRSVPVDLDFAEFGMDVTTYVSMIRANPGVMGLSSVPEWVPDDETVQAHALGKIPELKKRVSLAESYIRDSTNSHPHLEVKIFSIKTALSSVYPELSPPFDALDRIWEGGEFELYLIHALSVVTWVGSVNLSCSRYRCLLQRTLQILHRLKSSWTELDVERLLARNPLGFRLAGCELARLQMYSQAFRMFESTRGLVSSRTCNDPIVDLDVIDPITWVHLSHSPTGTYVVSLRDGVVIGEEFRDLSGKALVSAFFNFPNGGLMSDQESSRARASTAAMKLSELISPVLDWVDDHSGGRVVLIPGGMYQAFPVWSVGKLGESVVDGSKRVSTVPSRTIAYRNEGQPRYSGATGKSILLEASAVPGYSPLLWCELESAVFSATFPSSWTVELTSATAESLVHAFENSEVVHFSGHSFADLDPHKSAIVTYGSPLTVGDILGLGVLSSLCVLGSCQSGLAKNFSRQDEYLSIQTALYYAGARVVIGTCWPILDHVGFAFTEKFYSTLEKAGGVAPLGLRTDLVLVSVAKTTRWMKTATIGDVNARFAKYGVPQLRGVNSDRAFTFYDWAAFGVTAGPS